jgi:heme o synthase
MQMRALVLSNKYVSFLSEKVMDFGLLVKFKLSLTVVFSALMAYSIVCDDFRWSNLFLLFLGGFLVTGASNALNQVLEKDLDVQMVRTQNRPIASGRMSSTIGVLSAGLMAFFGICTLMLFNPMTAFLGVLSLISYAFIYTPMKRISPISVAIGAIPGAMPVLIGAVAHEGTISSLGLMLFNIQFLWQFVHFWAIAWLSDEDYKKAGFIFLPSKNGEKDQNTGLLSLFFGILLIVSSVLCFYFGYLTIYSATFLVLLNVYWSMSCWKLYKECSREAARKQMFISFAHLPLTLFAFLFDKFL